MSDIKRQAANFWPSDPKYKGALNYLKANFTGGHTLAELGQQMRVAGYDKDTHIVLSWSDTPDMHTIIRALEGHSEPMVRTSADFLSFEHKGVQILQPVNLLRLVKEFTNVPCMRLGYVYRVLAGRDLVSHRADSDVLMATYVIRRSVAGTREFLDPKSAA